MTAQDHKNQQCTALERVFQLAAFRKKRACDLCELWARRVSQIRRVICVNFALPFRRKLSASQNEISTVICVNFGTAHA